MTPSKVEQLQLLQQNMQHLLLQKQQLESQIVELDSALTELKTTEKAYKIVGKIMISTNKENLIKDLEEKKETVTVRVASCKSQEDKLKQSLVLTILNTNKELCVEKALIELEELNNVDMPSYHRTQLWDVISLLESAKQ